MALRRRLAWLAVALMCTVPLAAQSKRIKDVAAGEILVADKSLGDPNFAHTVVLLVQHEAGGVVGLIVNRPTTIPISEALRIKEAKKRSDPVYLGGPVDREVVMALTRAKSKPEGARLVVGKIYAVTTRTSLARTMVSPAKANTLRVYAGYAGWSASQLANEVSAGAWYIFPGEAATVFDPDPATLWTRMIAKTETRMAGGGEGLLAALEFFR